MSAHHLHRGIGQAVRLAFLQSGYNLGICSRNSIPEFTTVGIISQRAVVFVGDFTVACYRGEGDADGVASCHFLELNGLKTVGSIALTIRGCCTCGILVLIIVHRDGVHCIAAIRRDVYRQILAVHHIVIVGAAFVKAFTGVEVVSMLYSTVAVPLSPVLTVIL